MFKYRKIPFIAMHVYARFKKNSGTNVLKNMEQEFLYVVSSLMMVSNIDTLNSKLITLSVTKYIVY
jgi:hypothetical protein